MYVFVYAYLYKYIHTYTYIYILIRNLYIFMANVLTRNSLITNLCIPTNIS